MTYPPEDYYESDEYKRDTWKLTGYGVLIVVGAVVSKVVINVLVAWWAA